MNVREEAKVEKDSWFCWSATTLAMFRFHTVQCCSVCVDFNEYGMGLKFEVAFLSLTQLN